MEQKKLSTAEILARARAKDGGGGAKPAAAVSSPPAEPPAPAESPAPAAGSTAAASPASPAGSPAATPKSTKDILAAARAQATGKGGSGTAEAPAKPTAAAKSKAAKPAAAPPGGTKDILAAARAQAAAKAVGVASATAATATVKPAAAKPAAVKPAASPAGGTMPSVQEMLKAVRDGKQHEEPAPAPVKSAPSPPRVPTKPPAVAKPSKPQAAPRRNFLLAILSAPFALAWLLLSATGLISLLGAARFMFPNVLVEPPSKFKVGPPDDYPGGTVSNKWKALFGIWIVNADYQGKSLIYALSTVCTHLGCTPNWLDGEQKFKCPCHGSGFYITGVNFEGPAPRPLERFAIRRAEDGMLEVDKSQKFQQEMGQWDDPKSFVEVA